MIIKGIEFDFNPLNANHMDRFAAAEQQVRAESAAERQRVAQADGISPGEVLRGQCAQLHHFLDAVLGAGAADRMGLDGNDLLAYGEAVAELRRQVLDAMQSAGRLVQAAAAPSARTPAGPVHPKPPHKSRRRKRGGSR